MLGMLPIDTDTVVDCSPVVIGHPPPLKISTTNPYIGREQLFSSHSSIASKVKRVRMVTNHAGKEGLPMLSL